MKKLRFYLFKSMVPAKSSGGSWIGEDTTEQTYIIFESRRNFSSPENYPDSRPRFAGPGD